MDDTLLAPAHPPRTSALDSWPAHLVTAALTGVATARLPMQRWSRPARWAMHGGMGALAGASAALVAHDPGRFTPASGRDGDARGLGTGTAAAVGLATGLVVGGVSRATESVDGWAEGWLRRRGVRRPRLWMGVAAAGASLAISALDRRVAAQRETSREAQISPGSVGGGGVPGAGG
ncbi:hypothetical protein [Nocardioides sp. zg-1228]|uniref:hypothetical protein n=1 Tax=Nocardioides sp. zg-1228 TaxID=2763008 RepID=UPI00164308CE|nr:hypothetical protein [Nocardioides sp. zg-1228]MBC2934594.1 hypothetical protein [Nocardioides sp. zg-1228]QSF59344.1 hypothetical protein JX575_09415 [Nocardioides sp. zg-1228]